VFLLDEQQSTQVRSCSGINCKLERLNTEEQNYQRHPFLCAGRPGIVLERPSLDSSALLSAGLPSPKNNRTIRTVGGFAVSKQLIHSQQFAMWSRESRMSNQMPKGKSFLSRIPLYFHKGVEF
jgi:hypothetical protein